MSNLPQQQPSGQAPYPDPLPGIIPFGSICIMSGASGVGKTRLMASWFRAWLDGGLILGVQSNRPTGLYYLAVDRPWEPTYASIFASAGIAPHEYAKYTLLDDPSYEPLSLLEKGHKPLEHLKRCLDKLGPKPGGEVVIDPMSPLFLQGDQNNAKEVAVTIHKLRRLQEEYLCSFLCAANVKKTLMSEDFLRPQDRISGSPAFQAYGDTQFNFTQDGPNSWDTRTLFWVARDAPSGSEKFVFDEETRLFVRATGVVRDSSPIAEEDRPTRVLQLIPEDASIGAVDLLVLARACMKISRSLLYKVLDELCAAGRVIHTDGLYRKRKSS